MAMAVSGTDIANFTDVSSATVRGWKAGSHVPGPDTQRLLAQLQYVVSRLGEVRNWLYLPHPQLEGRLSYAERGGEDPTMEQIGQTAFLSGENPEPV